MNELLENIKVYARSILPAGSKLAARDDELIIICDGRLPDMAYECCLPPNHEGKCYCHYKDVEFTPEVGGPNFP